MSIGNQAFQLAGNRGGSEALRILMADDDPQEHILMQLAAEGVSKPLVFDFVPDGSRLLADLYVPTRADELPNLIILDLRMPRLNGHQTLEELQAHPLFWQVPVVVFTSSARVEDEERSYERGAVLFQTKPSSFKGMEEFLERAITIAKSSAEYHDIDGSEAINITDVVDVTNTTDLSLSTPPSNRGQA